jgi:VanZ family protein
VIASNTLRKAFLLLALAWAGLIWYLSDQSGLDIPQAFDSQDKALHLVAFGVLGFLVMGTQQLPGNAFPTGSFWKVCILCAGYGVLDEYHQSFVPGRNPDVFDVAADITGAVLGAWLLVVLLRRVLR